MKASLGIYSYLKECFYLYRQTSIIAIGDTKLLIILLHASIHQVTTCTRKLHIVVGITEERSRIFVNKHSHPKFGVKCLYLTSILHCILLEHHIVMPDSIKSIFGFPEEHSRTNRKHIWFFAYDLRMERGTVLILTSLYAQCQ